MRTQMVIPLLCSGHRALLPLVSLPEPFRVPSDHILPSCPFQAPSIITSHSGCLVTWPALCCSQRGAASWL